MALADFGLKGFIVRWIPAFILVFLTYNPLELSYYHWVSDPGSEGLLAVKVLLGLVLLIGYGIYLNATWKSMGPLGVFVIIVFFAVLLWVFWSIGWLKLDKPSDFAWLSIIILATVLAVGMSWSGIWRRLTGQVTTEHIDADHSP